MSTCLEHDILVAFIEGRLRGPEAANLQQHIDECPTCLELVTMLVRPSGHSSGAGLPAGASQQQGENGRATLDMHDELPASRAKTPISWLEPPAQLEEYRLVQPLGRGSMGKVYLYEDTRLHRRVAVKFINALSHEAAAQEQFLIEAQAVARLSHPNVLTVHRVGELQGQPFLVSEYVHGRSLAELKRPLSWEEVLRIGIELARGLAAAHRRGVLHRDIKPSNVMLTEHSEVKLLDFGLAKLLEEAPTDPSSQPAVHGERASPQGAGRAMVHNSAVVGTPLYMAPEIWRGEPATKRADVYSLGAVLYELCSGRLPHQGATLAELGEHVKHHKAAPLLALVPLVNERFGTIVDRCLERDLEQRFSDGEALCRAMEGLRIGAGKLPAGNPYRGLATFEQEHRTLFFGRAVETRELIELLTKEPLAILVGDSGSGKSSLCRAGVLPQVGDGAFADGRHWHVATLVPGRQPLVALSQSLALHLGQPAEALMAGWRSEPSQLFSALRTRLSDRDGLVIFIDQMEELITQSEAAQVRSFCEVLSPLFVSSPFIRILITVRSDFLSRVVALLGLSREIARCLYLLHPPSEESLREAIVGPAAATDVKFESEAIINDLILHTVQSDGGLPLLQFALAELWDARDRQQRLLSVDALVAIGGVSGALARHADRVIARLSAAQQSAARRILSKLVTIQGTRARCSEVELLTESPSDRFALEALVAARLVLAREDESARASYEIVHEALIQGWATLRSWLAEDIDHRAILQRLSTAAADWERLGRPRSVLWNERQLKELASIGISTLLLPPGDAAFIAASRHAAQRLKMLRWGGAAGAAITATAILFVSFKVSNWKVEKSINQSLAVTRAALTDAKAKEIKALELRRSAFTSFDQRQSEKGEADWAQYLTVNQEVASATAIAWENCTAALKLMPGHPAAIELSTAIQEQQALLEARKHFGRVRGTLPPLPTAKDDNVVVPPGFVYVPAGTFYYGSAEVDRHRYMTGAQPQHEISTGRYLIGETEVTYKEYIAYLEALPIRERMAHLPQGDVNLVKDDDGVWRLNIKPESCCLYSARAGDKLVYKNRTHLREQDWLQFPVSGILFADAVAYAAWLNDTGRLRGAHLCTDYEWERAARGGDARLFPHGDKLNSGDANFDMTYGHNPETYGPDMVRSHRQSNSPFGATDMAGNVWEWVQSVESDVPIFRGGCYSDDAYAAFSMNRIPSDKVWRNVRLGMRVCVDVK